MTIPLSALSFLLLLHFSCAPGQSRLTHVSGKTAYGVMGLEGVLVRALRKSGDRWEPFGETRSSYHGDFTFRLPEGEYTLTARATLQKREEEILLEGRLEGLVIEGGGSRVDRMVIELRPVDTP